ncbi:flocculation protein FLO11 [Drosophila innubila]|uniref:flocculation protein FLO11 n=1 Tax=Drosophila innubila TaxID=198719 RepID=UPI00148DBF6D|nr:flocculation protein FLO11 [Drosophila innubila]
MLFYFSSLSLLTVAWSWGYGGSEYYTPYCDHIVCPSTPSRERVCAKSMITNQEATFDNACEVQRYDCLSEESWHIINMGTCDCPTECPRNSNPVCAVLGSTWRTFKSACELRKHICSSKELWRQDNDEMCVLLPHLEPYPPYGQPRYGASAYGAQPYGSPFYGVPPAYGPHVYKSPAYAPQPPISYYNAGYLNPPPSPYQKSQMLPYHIYISRDTLPTELNGASNLETTESSVSPDTETTSSPIPTESTTDDNSTLIAASNNAPKIRKTSKSRDGIEASMGNSTTASSVTTETPKTSEQFTTPETTTKAPLSSTPQPNLSSSTESDLEAQSLNKDANMNPSQGASDNSTSTSVKPISSEESTTPESRTEAPLNETLMTLNDPTTIRTDSAIVENASDLEAKSLNEDSTSIAVYEITENSLSGLTTESTKGSKDSAIAEKDSELKIITANAVDNTTSSSVPPQSGSSLYSQDSTTPPAVNSRLASSGVSTEASLSSTSQTKLNSTTDSTTESRLASSSDPETAEKNVDLEVKSLNEDFTTTSSKDYTSSTAINFKLASTNSSTEVPLKDPTTEAPLNISSPDSSVAENASKLQVQSLDKDTADDPVAPHSESSYYPQDYTTALSVNSKLVSADTTTSSYPQDYTNSTIINSNSSTEVPLKDPTTETPLSTTSVSNSTTVTATSSPDSSVAENAFKLPVQSLDKDTADELNSTSQNTLSSTTEPTTDSTSKSSIISSEFSKADKPSELEAISLNKDSTNVTITTSSSVRPQYDAAGSSAYDQDYTTPPVSNLSSDAPTEATLKDSLTPTISVANNDPEFRSTSSRENRPLRLEPNTSDNNTPSSSSISQETTQGSRDPFTDSTTRAPLDTTTVSAKNSTPESQDRAMVIPSNENTYPSRVILQLSEDENAQTVKINNSNSNSVWILFLPSSKGKPINIVKQD